MRSLATVHGREHAVFWPFAGNREDRCINACMELRAGWLSGPGLPMRQHATTASGRKANEELWRRLADGGLVTIKADSGRRTHVKFTSTGETLTRCLCATGDTFTYWPVFIRFARLIDSTAEPSLPESFVAGCEPWTASPEQHDAIYLQQYRLLPFVTAGWVSFWHDCRGCQWLALTDAGRAAIVAGRPARPPAEWQLDEEVAKVYDAAFRSEMKRLKSAKPANQTNLYPPASAGLGWGDFRQALEHRRQREREQQEVSA